MTHCIILLCCLLVLLPVVYCAGANALQLADSFFMVHSRTHNQVWAKGWFMSNNHSDAMLFADLGDETIHAQGSIMHSSRAGCTRIDLEPMIFALLSNSKSLSLEGHTVFDREVTDWCLKLRRTLDLTQLNGTPFLLCSDPSSRQIRTIVGQEWLVHLRPMSSLNRELIHGQVIDAVSKCSTQSKLVDGPRFESPLAASSFTGMHQHRIESYSLDPWFLAHEHSCGFSWMRDDACERMPVKANNNDRVCVFLHGVGNTETSFPVNHFEDYWGQVNEYTPQCTERWFIRQETKQRGWDDEDLQKAYCDLALIHQPASDRYIRNKILFVHSMGNLVLAGAIKNKHCDIDVETTSWYEIQAPFRGSKAASELDLVCLSIDTGDWMQYFSPGFVKWVATTGGYCMPGTNQTYPAYQTLLPSYPGINELWGIAQPRIKGALCGGSSYGLYSRYSVPLSSLSLYVDYQDMNDGMVAWGSCQNGAARFEPDYKSLFYVGHVNHADGTCRNGNGLWGNDRQPCFWFLNKR